MVAPPGKEKGRIPLTIQDKQGSHFPCLSSDLIDFGFQGTGEVVSVFVVDVKASTDDKVCCPIPGPIKMMSSGANVCTFVSYLALSIPRVINFSPAASPEMLHYMV